MNWLVLITLLSPIVCLYNNCPDERTCPPALREPCVESDKYFIRDSNIKQRNIYYLIEGESFNLSCSTGQSFNYSDTDFTWTLPNKPSNAPGETNTDVSYIHTNNATKLDSGDYYCGVVGDGTSCRKIQICEQVEYLDLKCTLTDLLKTDVLTLNCTATIPISSTDFCDYSLRRNISILEPLSLSSKSFECPCNASCSFQTDVDRSSSSDTIIVAADVHLEMGDHCENPCMWNESCDRVEVFENVNSTGNNISDYLNVCDHLQIKSIQDRSVEIHYLSKLLNRYHFSVATNHPINYTQTEDTLTVTNLTPYTKHNLVVSYDGNRRCVITVQTTESAPEFPDDLKVTFIKIGSNRVQTLFHHLNAYSFNGPNFNFQVYMNNKKTVNNSAPLKFIYYNSPAPLTKDINVTIVLWNDFGTASQSNILLLNADIFGCTVVGNRVSWQPVKLAKEYLVIFCHRSDKSDFQSNCENANIIPIGKTSANELDTKRLKVDLSEGDVAMSACYADGCSKLTFCAHDGDKSLTICGSISAILVIVMLIIVYCIIIRVRRISKSQTVSPTTAEIELQALVHSHLEPNPTFGEVHLYNDSSIECFLSTRELGQNLNQSGDFIVEISKLCGTTISFSLVIFHEDLLYYVPLHTDIYEKVTFNNRIFVSIQALCSYLTSREIAIGNSPSVTLRRQFHNPLVISKNDIQISSQCLGEGVNGKVWRAILRKQQVVALKIPSETGVETTDETKLFQEAKVLRSFHHPNVIKLIGVSLFPSEFCIAMEFCSCGDLRTYLRQNSPNLEQKRKFCYEAASGMDHVASLNYIHRDLASRNCLLASSLSLKISDFGMAVLGPTATIESGLVSHRWTSPESLKNGVYGFKSDVWSFGVLMWEVFSDGDEPYRQFKNRSLSDLLEFIDKGNRLFPCSQMPFDLMTIMLDCWKSDPLLRPSFGEIVKAIGAQPFPHD